MKENLPYPVTIQTRGLSIGYRLKNGREKVVHPGIDIELRRGEVTCLLGLNGAGKSTLLRTLCGFQPPLQGEILLMGRPLHAYTRSELSRTVGVVLTEKTNAGGITVYELVALGRHPYTGFFGQLGARDHELIGRALDLTGIAHKAGNYVSELSDGERQKAMIAKVLVQECKVIILDEPTAFLDVTSRIETMVLLRRLAREEHKSILLSTHDLDAAIQMADRLWLQSAERNMITGTPEDLILEGQFGVYFNKRDIVFNPMNGKLETRAEFFPVVVDGEETVVFWVENALRREGYAPVRSESSIDCPHIHCKASDCITVCLPDGSAQVFDRISALSHSAIFEK